MTALLQALNRMGGEGWAGRDTTSSFVHPFLRSWVGHWLNAASTEARALTLLKGSFGTSSPAAPSLAAFRPISRGLQTPPLSLVVSIPVVLRGVGQGDGVISDQMHSASEVLNSSSYQVQSLEVIRKSFTKVLEKRLS